jgi:hypothetical protein
MQCPFCKAEMKAIDDGKPPPRLAMTWVCKQCPNEVRQMAEKDVDTEEWHVKHLSIFVRHNDKEYCLHWNYVNKHFDIRDIARFTGRDSYIFRLNVLPDSITLDNALDKLKTYLLFS